MPPVYEYQCDAGHTFEVKQGIKDNPLTKCIQPSCDSKCKRLISHTSFVLKGTGWARDGYSESK